MNTNLNSIENFNELVFEDRNKAYGAYAIRKSYNDNVTISLILSSVFFGLLALAAVLGTNTNNNIPKNEQILPVDSMISTLVDMKKPEPILEPKTKEQPQINKLKTDVLNITVTDKKSIDSVGLNKDANIVKDGTPKGKDTAHTDLPLVFNDKPKTEDNAIHPFVDVMPEFNGDVYKFIRDHLQYPRVAAENGTSGLVALSFVIEKDGSIGNISVLKNVADGCTEEAIRVVKLMPKWKPGQNHSEPARVMINLPVSFKLK